VLLLLLLVSCGIVSSGLQQPMPMLVLLLLLLLQSCRQSMPVSESRQGIACQVLQQH
jgi:hypothetical protein